MGRGCKSGTNLDEADILGLLTEALTADVETVFADETGTVSADAAVRGVRSSCPSSYYIVNRSIEVEAYHCLLPLP